MDDGIKPPMAYDEGRKNQRPGTPAPQQQINAADERGPPQNSKQTVRNGVMLEEQRRYGSRARDNADVLDTKQ